MGSRSAYRTEWVIFGEDGNIACSIDVVTEARYKSLIIIIEWKSPRPFIELLE